MEQDPNQKIWEYLEQQSVLNLATSLNGQPHAASCYYFFDPEKKCLCFKSPDDTRHIKELKCNPNVGGTVLPNKAKTGRVLGAQLTGFAHAGDSFEGGEGVKKEYYKKYPYALPMAGNFWIIELNYVKLTDSLLGIGKRLIWKR